MGVQVPFWYSNSLSFGYIPSSRIAGIYDRSISNVLRNLHTVFHTGCPNLHSHQLCANVSFFPYPHWHLSYVVICAILMGVKWYLIVFNLHFPDDYRCYAFLSYLFAIHVFLWEMSIRSFAHVLSELLVFLLLNSFQYLPQVFSSSILSSLIAHCISLPRLL